jgi:hypothetical protein
MLVSRELRLLLERDGVHIGGGDGAGNSQTLLVGSLYQLGEEVSGAYRSVLGCYRVERVEPLLGLDRVAVDELVEILITDGVSEIRRHEPQVS